MSSRAQTIAVLGAAALVAAVIGVWALVVEPRRNSEAAACARLRAYISEYGAIQHSTRAPAHVAIIGDSYTAGDTLERREDSWAYSVGGVLSGIGSTGFLNGGYCGSDAYATRIGAVVSSSPDTLVIQGGLNDTGKSAETVKSAARDLLSKASDVRRVFVVGPIDAPKRDGEATIDMALAEAVRASGREYVSALDWSDVEFGPDGVHPTAHGHDAFAAHVRAAAGLAVAP